MSSFFDLFTWARHLKWFDPKDRVYALLSIIDPKVREDLALMPDYAKTFLEFYQELHIKFGATYQLNLGPLMQMFQKVLRIDDHHETVQRVMSECNQGDAKIYPFAELTDLFGTSSAPWTAFTETVNRESPILDSSGFLLQNPQHSEQDWSEFQHIDSRSMQHMGNQFSSHTDAYPDILDTEISTEPDMQTLR